MPPHRDSRAGSNPKSLSSPHVFRYSEAVRELTAFVVPCWWVSSIVSTRFRALPLLFCAFTSASTSVWAGPAVRPATCYEIRSGDTAARLAQRFTGNEFNRYENWFQIVDPVTGGFIAKSRYNVIQSGWHVCVATDMLRLRTIPAGYSAVPPRLPVLAATALPVNAAVIDRRMLWWSTPLLVLISALLLAWSWKQIDERRVRGEVMKRFGNRFIAEFERPLSRGVASRPIRSRLRYASGLRKVEILLAPAKGHTYPNLVDHRRNLEYDVDRVLHLLRHEPFIGDSPYAEGRWVVIPCRLETGR
jgi:hypothetical protein